MKQKAAAALTAAFIAALALLAVAPLWNVPWPADSDRQQLLLIGRSVAAAVAIVFSVLLYKGLLDGAQVLRKIRRR